MLKLPLLAATLVLLAMTTFAPASFAQVDDAYRPPAGGEAAAVVSRISFASRAIRRRLRVAAVVAPAAAEAEAEGAASREVKAEAFAAPRDRARLRRFRSRFRCSWGMIRSSPQTLRKC